MSLNYKVIFAMVALLAWTASRAEEHKACDGSLAVAAEISLDRALDWNDLYVYWKKYPGCDDGILSEGVSEKVVGFLLRDFSGLLRFARRNLEGEYFDFIISHINETLHPESLLLISTMTKECDEVDKEFCGRLERQVNYALHNM